MEAPVPGIAPLVNVYWTLFGSYAALMPFTLAALIAATVILIRQWKTMVKARRYIFLASISSLVVVTAGLVMGLIYSILALAIVQHPGTVVDVQDLRIGYAVVFTAEMTAGNYITFGVMLCAFLFGRMLYLTVKSGFPALHKGWSYSYYAFLWFNFGYAIFNFIMMQLVIFFLIPYLNLETNPETKATTFNGIWTFYICLTTPMSVLNCLSAGLNTIIVILIVRHKFITANKYNKTLAKEEKLNMAKTIGLVVAILVSVCVNLVAAIVYQYGQNSPEASTAAFLIQRLNVLIYFLVVILAYGSVGDILDRLTKKVKDNKSQQLETSADDGQKTSEDDSPAQ